ncbi:hypothetical protein SCB49_11117 [unidentified eubacterium SCB49]|nr:hypothetical protein SCB49_11117 [unidentified eubacterium SCB49]
MGVFFEETSPVFGVLYVFFWL